MSTDTITAIRALAKRFARARRMKHISALEIVARELGKSHWRGLAEAYKQGWRPSLDEMESLRDFLANYSDPTAGQDADQSSALGAFGDGLVFTSWKPGDVQPMDADDIDGELDGHRFYLVGDDFSVAIGSQGWEIILDQSPAAKPVLRRLGGRVKSVEQLAPAFIERATQLLKIRAQRMYAEVASTWPRRSTMPDQNGRARHPLGHGLSAVWHCLHCDGVHEGATMAKTLWHCPDCGATPIDIFREPFWSGAGQAV